MFGRRRIEAEVGELRGAVAALTAALARVEARLEAAPAGAAPANLSEALVGMMSALMEQQTKRGDVQAKLIDGLFDKAAKAALAGTAAEMGRRGRAIRAEKEKKADARDAYIREVCEACAECEARLFNRASRDPSDLARHLTDQHDAKVLQAARQVLAGQIQIEFNGKPASGV